MRLSYLQVLALNENTVVPGTFEVSPIEQHTFESLRNNGLTTQYYKYQLQDGKWAHGKVTVDGPTTPPVDHRKHDSELTTKFLGYSDDKDGAPRVSSGKMFTSINHGIAHQVSKISRDVVQAHMDKFPGVFTISGATSGEYEAGKTEQKLAWRLRSMRPLQDQFDIAMDPDRGPTEFRITRKKAMAESIEDIKGLPYKKMEPMNPTYRQIKSAIGQWGVNHERIREHMGLPEKDYNEHYKDTVAEIGWHMDDEKAPEIPGPKPPVLVGGKLYHYTPAHMAANDSDLFDDDEDFATTASIAHAAKLSQETGSSDEYWSKLDHYHHVIQHLSNHTDAGDRELHRVAKDNLDHRYNAVHAAEAINQARQDMDEYGGGDTGPQTL